MERFETVDDLANADLEELTAFIDEKAGTLLTRLQKPRRFRPLPEILTAAQTL